MSKINRRDFLKYSMAASGLLLPSLAPAWTGTRMRKSIGRALPRQMVYVTNVSYSGSAVTTHTFNNVNLGTPASNRLVVMYIATDPGTGASVTSGLSSVTVGGVEASFTYGGGTAATVPASFMQIADRSNATADIVVNVLAGNVNTMVACTIGIWALYGLESETRTATGWAAPQSSSLSTTIAVQAGGMLLAGVSAKDHTAQTFNWTAGATEKFDLGTPAASGADADIVSAATRTLSVTSTSGDFNQLMAVHFK